MVESQTGLFEAGGPDGTGMRHALERAQSFTRQDPRWKSYDLMETNGRWRRAVSVSKVVGMLDKSKFLKVWAARMERDGVLEVVGKMLDAGDEITPVSILRQLPPKYFHETYQKDAADAGTVLHSLIEAHIRSMLDPQAPRPKVAGSHISDEVLFDFEAVKRWMDSVSFEPLGCETRVFDRSTRVVGAIDTPAILTLPGQLRDVYVVDWKRAKKVYDEYYLQSALLRRLLTTTTTHTRLKAPVDGLIVKIEEEGIFTDVVPSANDHQYAVALDALTQLATWSSGRRK